MFKFTINLETRKITSNLLFHPHRVGSDWLDKNKSNLVKDSNETQENVIFYAEVLEVLTTPIDHSKEENSRFNYGWNPFSERLYYINRNTKDKPKYEYVGSFILDLLLNAIELNNDNPEFEVDFNLNKLTLLQDGKSIQVLTIEQNNDLFNRLRELLDNLLNVQVTNELLKQLDNEPYIQAEIKKQCFIT